MPTVFIVDDLASRELSYNLGFVMEGCQRSVVGVWIEL
jgi:hypothetical protein